MRWAFLFSLAVAASLLIYSSPKDVEWHSAGGDPGYSHYSPLQQINRSNVQNLELAWRFDSGDEYEGSEMQANPLIIDGKLYTTTPRLRVVALDASTGKLLWDFDPRKGEKMRGKQRNRGLTYWTDGKEQRLFVGIDEKLYSLDARTGKLDAAFGEDGRIDMRDGLGRPKESQMVRAISPGVVYKNLLILGSLVSEDLPASPGFVRAFDVRTGKVAWTFHTIPQPGEFGYDTWPKDAHKYIGGANSWPGLTLDEKRGTVFVPTGSAAFDFYGANRHGDNLFANCLLALKADTGERLWHFQFVKHDVWDRDLPTAPTLVRVKHDGRVVDAVAQTTKSGFVWVFDRETGKSLFPFEEVSVPPSDVDGEMLATKQVLPKAPAPFARQALTEDMLSQRTPEIHADVLNRFKAVRSGPQFTPPSFAGSIVFPGFDGGAEWGGSAFDPETGILYVNANEMAWILRLVPRRSKNTALTSKSIYQQNCSGCHRADRKGSPPEFPALDELQGKRTLEQIEAVVQKGAGRMPGFAHLGVDQVRAASRFALTGEDAPFTGAEQTAGGPAQLKYGIDGYNKFLDADGFPAVAPPWGTLNAINLNDGSYAWKIPFGEYPELAAKGLKNTGTENYGGGVVTAGGLLFIGATNADKKFHAFDKTNGKLLWETTLPSAGNATPAVYSVHGTQYVVIGAGGGKWRNASGGSYLAFRLKGTK